MNNKEKRFENLVIIGEPKRINGRIKQMCLCDCGNIKYVEMSKLRSGHTKSCGYRKIKCKIRKDRFAYAVL